MRRTKIVATLGPASQDDKILRQLIRAGMNVGRLNMSHGNHKEHLKRIKSLRRLAKEEARNVALMVDTKGPEIRTGPLATKEVFIEEGQTLTLTTEDILGDKNRISVSFPGLPLAVGPGDQILLDDGLVGLTVLEVNQEDILCRVHNDGRLTGGRGVNVPGKKMDMPFLSPKDREDIAFALAEDVDFIALSFVQHQRDVQEVRALLDEAGSDIKIVAKIENIFAVDNIKAIISAADAVMIARGDLGVEVPFAQVPLIQKKIIRYCYERATPVITATQMLDSMIRHPRPTRAEVTDVANAVLDGTDCVMLSGETAAGDYPLEALEAMDDIVCQAEDLLLSSEAPFLERNYTSHHPITDSISLAAVSMANTLEARALIVPTRSGFTPRMVAKYRPRTQVVAVVSSLPTQRYMTLVWGVEVVDIPQPADTDAMMQAAQEACQAQGYIQQGDLVVITAGVPVGVSGKTNLLKVEMV